MTTWPGTERALIKDAILKKGLEPSMDSENKCFLWRATNWNKYVMQLWL